jgi:hypothetical protein
MHSNLVQNFPTNFCTFPIYYHPGPTTISMCVSKLHGLIDSDLFWKWTGGDSFELLYSSPTHGLQAYPFHARCDNRGPTPVVLQSPEGYIFGGFSSVSWRSQLAVVADPSGRCFLFTLKNPHGISPTKYTHGGRM